MILNSVDFPAQGSAGFRGKSKNFIEDDDDFSFEFLNWEDENKK